MDNDQPSKQSSGSNKLNLSLDLRVVVLLLLAVIAAMLFAWKPWTDKAVVKNDQVITVTGESKITAAPDEFIFYPTYDFKNSNKNVALAELTKQSETIVAKLKELGVSDSKIKTDADGNNYNYRFDQESGQSNYTLRLTVKADSKELAEKVQDYLVTTAPTGAVSPQANFSDKKRKQLESQARDEATKDARSKAEQSARNLSFKIGKLKSIRDISGFGGITPLYGFRDGGVAVAEDTANTKLAVQPGENDLTYAVEVVYYLQ